MSRVPKGYVALTSSYDGSTFLIDAQGLTITPLPGHTGGSCAFPANCEIGVAADTERFLPVVETFDEVRAKLAAALGEQGEGDPRSAYGRVLQDLGDAIGCPPGRDILDFAKSLAAKRAAPESDAAQRAFAARVLKDIAKVGHVVAQEYLLTRADELCAGSAPKPAAADLAATERAAAAKALREAARDFVGARSADDEWTAEDVRAWLRARAAAIEGGAL